MIVGVNPVGAGILVRHLTAQETLGTTLQIAGAQKAEIPQGIILAFGPVALADNIPEKYGIQVGDRVILNGKGTMVPSWDDNEYGLVDPHIIKGVVVVE